MTAVLLGKKTIVSKKSGEEKRFFVISCGELAKPEMNADGCINIRDIFIKEDIYNRVSKDWIFADVELVFNVTLDGRAYLMDVHPLTNVPFDKDKNK